MVWEPWRPPFIVDPTYYRTTDDYYVLAVRTELTARDAPAYDVQTVCADRLDYYWATYDVLST
jgi:hypothetical protein